MTITTTPTIEDGCLMVRGKVILNKVSQKVVVSQASSRSAFIGATSTSPSSHYVFTHGVLEGYKFLCIFLDGRLRTSLQGTPSNQLQFALRVGDISGDTTIKAWSLLVMNCTCE